MKYLFIGMLKAYPPPRSWQVCSQHVDPTVICTFSKNISGLCPHSLMQFQKFLKFFEC